MGIAAPRNAFARLTVNGEYWGLFALVEPVSKPFLATSPRRSPRRRKRNAVHVRARFLAAFVASALAASGARCADEKVKLEPPPGWQAKPFSLEKPSAGFKIALKGYVQADFSSYQDWTAEDADGASSLPPEFEWQRARIGLEGKWRRLSFEVDVDPAFDKGDELKDAWIGLRLSKALQFRGGNVKVPVSPEFLVSPAKTDFVERAAVVDSIGPARDWGALVHGEISRVVEYQAGVFAGDDRSSDLRAATTGAGRVVLKPAPWLDLGGSFSQGDVQADAAGPGLDPEPKGLAGTSVSRLPILSLGVRERATPSDAERTRGSTRGRSRSGASSSRRANSARARGRRSWTCPRSGATAGRPPPPGS